MYVTQSYALFTKCNEKTQNNFSLKIFYNSTLKTLETQEFHFSKIGQLFWSFCVFRFMEHNPLCYGSIDNQFSIENILHSQSEISD